MNSKKTRDSIRARANHLEPLFPTSFPEERSGSPACSEEKKDPPGHANHARENGTISHEEFLILDRFYPREGDGLTKVKRNSGKDPLPAFRMD